MNATSDTAVSNLNHDFFSSKHKAINTLYVDMSCFQDTTLGALLFLLENDQQYKYVLSKIKEYNNRRSHENIMDHFPELPFSNEQIEETLNNRDIHNKLISISPFSKYYYRFHDFMSLVEHNNKMSPDFISPHLFIGCDRVIYPEAAKTRLIDTLKRYHPLWHITITDKPIYEYGEELIIQLDHFSLYDISKFLQHDRMLSLIQNKNAMLFKSVHAFSLVEVDDPELDTSQLVQNTEIVFGLFCDFKYIDMRLLYE